MGKKCWQMDSNALWQKEYSIGGDGPKARIRQMICLLASAEFAKWKSQNRKGVKNCGTHICYTKNSDRPSDSDSGDQLSRPSILFAEASPRSASKSLPKNFKYTKYPTWYTGETLPLLLHQDLLHLLIAPAFLHICVRYMYLSHG